MDRTDFQFKWIDDEGRVTSFLVKRGWFDGETLMLADVAIPVSSILRAQEHLGNTLLSVVDAEGSVGDLLVWFRGARGAAVRQAVNVAASAAWADARRREFSAEGHEDGVRTESCPYCLATIPVVGLARSAQVYCPYCDTVVTAGRDPHEEDRHLRPCGRCTLYARPTDCTFFAAYYLVVIYGYWFERVRLCRACMREESWRWLGLNLLGLVGLPFAAWQVGRAYFGERLSSTRFAGLAAANSRARKRELEKAVRGYREIQHRVGPCAGIKVNIAYAILHPRTGFADDSAQREAAAELEDALRDCSNYVRAYEMLCPVYVRLADVERLTKLRTAWGDSDALETDLERMKTRRARARNPYPRLH